MRAMCMKHLKQKCRICFVCGFLQGNKLSPLTDTLSPNGVLPISRPQTNENYYIKGYTHCTESLLKEATFQTLTEGM